MKTLDYMTRYGLPLWMMMELWASIRKTSNDTVMICKLSLWTVLIVLLHVIRMVIMSVFVVTTIILIEPYLQNEALLLDVLLWEKTMILFLFVICIGVAFLFLIFIFLDIVIVSLIYKFISTGQLFTVADLSHLFGEPSLCIINNLSGEVVSHNRLGIENDTQLTVSKVTCGLHNFYPYNVPTWDTYQIFIDVIRITWDMLFLTWSIEQTRTISIVFQSVPEHPITHDELQGLELENFPMHLKYIETDYSSYFKSHGYEKVFESIGIKENWYDEHDEFVPLTIWYMKV